MRSRHAILPFLLTALCLIPVAPVGAQAPPGEPADVTHGAGVALHQGLDGIYQRFARAYRELDPALVAALYTEDALYLPGGGPMQRGRGKIEAGFERFFDRVRSEGGRLEIAFEILDRTVADGLAADVGIYTLRRFGAEGEKRSVDRGKFTVVAVPGEDGAWRFHVDSFSPLGDPAPAPEEAPPG